MLDGFFENNVELDELDNNELEGVIDEIGRLPRNHRYRRVFVNKIRRSRRMYERRPATTNLTAKAEFEKRMNRLPAGIKKDLRNGNSQIVDTTIYGVRLIGGSKQVDVFKNADVKTVGVTSLNARKLEKDKPMLVTAIRLTAGVGSAGTETQADINGTSFGRVPKELANGEFALKVDGKFLIPEHSSMNKFDTYGHNGILTGYHKLDNPKWIEPQAEIDFEIELGVAAADKTYVKVELIGASPAKQ